MARLYTSGAEFNDSTGSLFEYDTFSSPAFSTSSTTFRSGAFSWSATASAGAPYATKQYTSGNNDSYVRAYINVTSLTTASSISILLIRDATSGNNLDVRLTRVDASTYTLILNDEQASSQIGNTSSNLSTNTWYRLEFSYVRSTGAAAAYIDGVQFASGTASANLNSNTLRWGVVDAATMTIFFDDIAVNDNTGTAQTGLPGDGKVIRLKPNAAGDANTFATQTGGTAGAANNFTRVNEAKPNDATTFNGSSTLNEEDMFEVDDSGIGASDTVNVVEVWGRHRNSTADTTAAIKYQIKKTTGGTLFQGSAIVPNSATWRMNGASAPIKPSIILYSDPDNAAWTQSTLDSMQVGYKLTTGPGTAGRRIDVTSVSAIVDYTPGVAPAATGTNAFKTLLGVGL